MHGSKRTVSTDYGVICFNAYSSYKTNLRFEYAQAACVVTSRKLDQVVHTIALFLTIIVSIKPRCHKLKHGDIEGSNWLPPMQKIDFETPDQSIACEFVVGI